MQNHRYRYSYSEQVKLAVVLLTVTVVLVSSDWLWRWDQQIYDTQLRNWSTPAPEDVLIVAIDEASLVELGRWPWSRRVHAQLIDKLSATDAKSIILDIIFAEKNQVDSEGDKALELAIKNAGNVVLPVLVEQPRLGAQLKETLPMSSLIEAGAKLGHVHIELDGDGIARSVYLYEGLGNPHWPNISLTALQLQTGAEVVQAPLNDVKNPNTWYREEHRLIPFLGPPGHFQRISYKEILSGNFSPKNIRGKTIIVGVTATGLGDALPTPVSGLTHPMPGVEINANIYTAIRDGRHITILDKSWRLFLSVIIVLLPVLLFPRISPGSALFLAGGLILVTSLLSMLLLSIYLIWFPPLAVILSLALSYPIWSWRRLNFTVEYLNAQLALLHDEPRMVPEKHEINLKRVAEYLASVLPFDGWAIYDEDGLIEFEYNCKGLTIPDDLNFGCWIKKDDLLWLKTEVNQKLTYIVLEVKTDEELSEVEFKLLKDISEKLYPEEKNNQTSAVEKIESQILKLQSASSRLRALRQFITQSLEQMAEGVIILTPLGEVELYNQKSTEIFSELLLRNSTLVDIIGQCKLEEAIDWKKIFIQVLLDRIPLQIQAVHKNGNELLIQFAALTNSEDKIVGVIVNFSDITHLKDNERKRIEFINFLSHDLRSPLSSALAIIQIQQQTDMPVNSNDLIRLKQYTERALLLTEDFVQIARAENIDSINFSESNLVDVVYNAVDQLWELSRDKNITVHVDSELHSAMINADAVLIERAVINLVNNAIKYSSEGGEVALQIKSSNGHYVCSVSDSGEGIPEEELPKIFDRFHRVQRVDKNMVSGIGLGLAFVKTVIEGHHGIVKVESVASQGSTFTFKLPKFH